MHRFLLAVLLAFFALVPASAQTAESVKTLLDKYRTERDEALKSGEPAERVTAADQLKTKAEAAAKSENFVLAAKLVREARWSIPARPQGLPDHVERVIGYVRLRHGDCVNSIAYTPDGEKLVTASKDGTARVWDLANGRELLIYKGHTVRTGDEKRAAGEVDDQNVLKVPAVAISADGSTVATTGSGEIHLWELKTGKLKKKLTTPTSRLLRGLAFLPDGKSLITGGDDKIVRIWNLETGEETTTFLEANGRMESLSVSPNGKLFAVATSNGMVSVFKSDGSDPKSLLATPPATGLGNITSIAFTGDGSKLLLGGSDKNLRLVNGLNLVGTSPAGTLSVQQWEGHTAKINCVTSTKDGKLAASASDDKSVRVWDTTNGKSIRQYPGLLSSPTAVAIRPDGKQLAIGCDDGTLRVSDLSASDEHRASSEAKDAIWTTSFNADGSRFATAGADRLVRVYATNSGKLEHTLTGHKAAVTSAVFLPKDRLATAGGDKVIKIWDAKTGQAIRELTGHTSAVLALANEGTLLLSGSFDKSVKSWNIEDGKPIWSWTSRSAVASLAIRKAGKQIAVGTSDGWLNILDISAAEPKLVGTGQQTHVAGVAAVAYTNDGNRIATVGGDGKLILWNVGTDGTPSRITKDDGARKPATGPTALSAVVFSPDGRLVASAGADAAVHITDTSSGAEVRTLRAHSDWVTTLAFSPDGERLLSVGVDKIARLFDMGKSEATVQIGHMTAARSIAVRKDGKLIASGSNDKSIKVWELATGKEIATLTGPTADVNAVGFVGLDRVVAGGDDGALRTWSIDPSKLVKNQPFVRIFVVQPSADGKTVGVWSREETNGTNKETIEIAAVENATVPKPIVLKNSKASCVTFAFDLSLAAVGDETGNIAIWDFAKGTQEGSEWAIHTKRLSDIAMTADKKTLVAVDEEGNVKIADFAKREVLHSVKSVGGTVGGIMMAGSNDKFAVFSSEGEIKTFDLKGKELRLWSLPSGVNGVAFTPDGKKLITANGDGTLAVLLMP